MLCESMPCPFSEPMTNKGYVKFIREAVTVPDFDLKEATVQGQSCWRCRLRVLILFSWNDNAPWCPDCFWRPYACFHSIAPAWTGTISKGLTDPDLIKKLTFDLFHYALWVTAKARGLMEREGGPRLELVMSVPESIVPAGTRWRVMSTAKEEKW